MLPTICAYAGGPLTQGESYHQFHTNPVLGRYVPHSYTGTLKDAQQSAGLGCWIQQRTP